MPRKCIDLESQPGFQEIYAPNMQRAIDEGLSGYSGTGVVDWGYDQDEVVKPPPRIKDESTKPRRKRKDFSRGKDESWRANRVRRQLFEAEEIGNPKGIFAQSIINGISNRGLDFIGRFLEANPLNTITWHGNKKKTSHFSVSGADGKFTFNITMKRGKSKIVSRVARHEFGHFVDYVLGLMAYKYDTRSQALYFSDLFPAFGEAFQKEITRLGLEPKKTVKGTGKEFIDKLVEDLVGPVDKITSQGLGIGSMNDILSEAAGILDIADAMTGGAWASRKFGGGHGIKYYKLKDADINGNPRLHETFANLFESWSSKDKRSWKRMKKYFPELTKEFDKMMSIYGDTTTIFNSANPTAPTPTTTTTTTAPDNLRLNRLQNRPIIKDLPFVFMEHLKGVALDDRIEFWEYTDDEIVSEARYFQSKYDGNIGFEEQEDLAGLNGKEIQKTRRREYNQIKRFISKWSKN